MSTVDRLLGLIDLGRNWDSYGAAPIDPANVEVALRILSRIKRKDTPPPCVVPTSRGGIQLEWHLRGIDLEIEIVTPTLIQGLFEDQRTGDAWEMEVSSNLQPLADAIATLSARA